jgi:leucyl-tRNA synthetase
MGPFDQAIAWNIQGVKGVRRFLERVWLLVLESKNRGKSDNEVLRQIHKLNQKITSDIELMKFNTAVAAMMEFLNFAESAKEKFGKDAAQRLVLFLSPFAPHICEELWKQLGNGESICRQSWPQPDQSLLKENTTEYIVQINGKMRDKISITQDLGQEQAVELAKSSAIVQKWIGGKPVKKIVYVKGRLINFVI